MRHAAGELSQRLHLVAVGGIGLGFAQRLLDLFSAVTSRPET